MSPGSYLGNPRSSLVSVSTDRLHTGCFNFFDDPSVKFYSLTSVYSETFTNVEVLFLALRICNYNDI